MSMSGERRKHSRISFAAHAVLALPNRRYEVELVDISFKGALVRLVHGPAPEEKTEGTLYFNLSELESKITMEIVVMHVGDDKVGLLCNSIDLDSVTHLRRLVELNLGDSALLEREFSALIKDS